jgi:hypothetical protein
LLALFSFPSFLGRKFMDILHCILASLTDISRRKTSFTYFPYTESGDELFDFFKQVVGVHPIKKTLNAIDWNVSSNPGQFMLALITFLYVDILDSTATLYSTYIALLVFRANHELQAWPGLLGSSIRRAETSLVQQLPIVLTLCL